MKKSLGANTYAIPTPVWLVGSYDKEGKPNLVTIAWGGVCSSDPPAVNFSIRKSRHSYDGIVERKSFTINVPSEKYVREADYAGIVSGRDADKFAVAGLTAVKSEVVDAPYVGEFPLVLECRLLQIVEVGAHIQFIGQIVDVKAEESVLDEQGLPDAEKVLPVLFTPSKRLYHGIGACLGTAYSIGKELIK